MFQYDSMHFSLHELCSLAKFLKQCMWTLHDIASFSVYLQASMKNAAFEKKFERQMSFQQAGLPLGKPHMDKL